MATLLLGAMCAYNIANAQVYQLPNGNFESWNNNIPIGWNTFNSSTGPYASFASSNHHSQETGHTGTGSCIKLYSSSILGVIANGNITTGRINAGSMTAANSANYNFTDRTNSYAQPFNGTPDSMYVWTKMTAASNSTQAVVRAYIHGNTDFKDPNDCSTPSLYKGKVSISMTPHNNWTLQKAPFIYDGTSSVNYIIVTLTTNATPGGGSGGDALYVDDLEFIYSAWLTDLKMNGTTITGFQKDVFDYYVEYPRGTSPLATLPTLTYTTEVNDATVAVTTSYTTPGSIDGATHIVTSTAEDGVTKKIYRIHYSINKSSDNNLSSFTWTLGTDTTTINVNNTSYNITLPAGTTDAPAIIGGTTADTAAAISITQATGPNGIATITVTAENGSTKIYTIHFSVALSDNANLLSISYNGIPITQFNADTLHYYVSLPSGTVLVPYVSATAQWPGIYPAILSASSLPGTTTITVTAEDGITTKTYYVHFSVEISVNADLAWIRYNNLSLPGFHADTTNYTIQVPYGTSQVAVTAAAATGSASVLITQPATIPGTATITVTAEDTSVHKTYSIYFEIGKNNNAYLADIQYIIGNDTIKIPRFNALIEHYNISLPEGTTTPPIILASTQDSNATLLITQASSPYDTAVITVTAENEITTKTYTIQFSVTLSNNANLDSIMVNGALLPGFSSATYTYNIALDTAVIPVVSVHCEHNKASSTITYPQNIPGQILITVTAEDTNVKRTYKLNLTISASNNPDLVDLGYSLLGTDYSIQSFHPDTTIYHITLPAHTTATPILTFQVADMGATAQVTQPDSPNGVGIIMITAADSITYKIYQVYFQVAISNNANLASLSYAGTPIATFHPDSMHYYITLPYTALAADSISATTADSFAAMYIQQAHSYNDSAMVMIIAEDNTTFKTYTIHFSREWSPIATLSNIGYTLNYADSCVHNFQSTLYDYTVVIAEEETHLPTIYYQVTDNRSHAYMLRTPTTINDTAQIVVVAENLTDSNIYTVAFHYTPSSNTYLDTISINGIVLENFNKDSINYNITLPWGTTTFPTIYAHALWHGAQVQITPASTIFGTAQIRVVAENGTNQRTYNLHFKEGSNADILALGYTLGLTTDSIPVHGIQDSIFHVTLPIGNTLIPSLTYTLNDTRSTATLSQASSPNDTAILTVEGWDKLSLRHYYVIFRVERSTEAMLTDLQVDGVTIAGFNSDTLNYAIEYAYGYNNIPVITATASQPDATITCQPVTQYPGDAFITVYAGDTSIHTTYTIHFSVEPGNNNYLDTIICTTYPITDFDKYTNYYHITLEYGTTYVPEITAVAEDSRSIINIIPAIGTSDTTHIQVIAINGDTNTYYVTFSVALCPDATLTSITIDGQVFEKFTSGTRNYKYPVAPTFIGIPAVTATTTDPNATYTVINADSIPGQTKIEVTAADGTTTMTYRLNFYLSEEENINENTCTYINIYPNPTSDNILINIDNSLINSWFILYDMQGKQLICNQIPHTGHNVNISHLPKATYIYVIRYHNLTVKTGKITKF